MCFAGSRQHQTNSLHRNQIKKLNKEEKIVLHNCGCWKTASKFHQRFRIMFEFCYVNIERYQEVEANPRTQKSNALKIKNKIITDYQPFSPCCKHENAFIVYWLGGSWKISFWINFTLSLWTVDSSFHPINDMKLTWEQV